MLERKILRYILSFVRLDKAVVVLRLRYHPDLLEHRFICRRFLAEGEGVGP